MSIYSEIIRHASDQGLIVVDNVLERMSASIGGHVLNLANLDHRMFLKNRSPMNFRGHIVYVAPSGWTKSTYFRLMLRQGYGLLNSNVFPIDVHSSFSVASWFGTIKEDKETGQYKATSGVIEKYKRGIIGADDYQTLKLMLDGEGIGEDERALMTLLDTDEGVKNLSTGQIRIKNVGMSAWFGMRPTSMKLTSGFARRFWFAMYFPTRREAILFRKLARRQIQPCLELETDTKEECPLASDIGAIYDHISACGPCELDMNEIDGFLDQWDIPHFEENLYRTLAIGWSVANHEYPRIRLDDKGRKLLEDEILNREILRTDPWRMMFYRILSDEPSDTMQLSSIRYFLKAYLQLTEGEADDLLRREKLSGRVVYEGEGKNKTVTLKWEPDYTIKMEVKKCEQS